MTSSRIASSSRPSSSICSAVRWAVGSMAVNVFLPFDVAGARCGGHTGLDEDARLGRGDLAGAQVADGAGPERGDAAETDAHTAPGGHEHAGLLADVQQRRG